MKQEACIHVNKLRKSFGKTKALNGVSFQVEAGEMYAYLGPNGAGKTTTIGILAGLTRRDEGEVRIGGFDITQEPLACKSQFGLVPQYTNLDSELSVEENLLIHGLLHHLSRKEISSRIKDLLRYLEIEGQEKIVVKNLSGGMKRRVLIARALLHRPKVLFLDEPTVGLDPAIRRSIWGFIKKIQQDGATILLTTHYIEEAEFLAQRVAFLDQGQIVAEDRPSVLMAAVGDWAVDYLEESRLCTDYFRSREEAADCAHHRANGCTVRRVNLEDAFISMTGRKIA
jgi:ABC-2 type transport system ATP-binding protein